MNREATNSILMKGIGAQVTAADPVGSVWVSANAGTGKTRVLVDRISRLLLAGIPAHKILCLTFTKAAAAEMANRLNVRLGNWAAFGEAELEKALLDLFGRLATSEEIARAPMLFAETIESPEGLRIRTIHSFCESLLGRFPLESGLTPHFTVIDERRAVELREEARDRVLGIAANAEDAAINKALSHIAGLLNEEGFADVMTELDIGRHRLHAMVQSQGGLGGVIAAGRDRLGLGSDETHDTIITAATIDDAFDKVALTDAVAVLGGGSKADINCRGKLKRWLERPAKQRATCFVADCMPIFLTKKKQPRANSGLMTKRLADAYPGTLEALITEQKRVFEISEKLKAASIADNTHALLTIGVALLDTYESLKISRALVDYDDLIEKAQQLLGKPGGVSWVHYKLDGGIDHILVDEAQDTSSVQWAVIKGLAGSFFSGQGRPIESSRTIFAVGDEKQSIFSFQGADPAEFGATGERVGEQARAAGESWNPIEMALSWRSAPAILAAVDAVFAREDAADGLSWDGRPVRHQCSRDGEAGLVDLWPVIEPLAIRDESPWDAPLDQVTTESPDVRLAVQIADTIDRWLVDGEELASQGRAIRPGDIMILVRSRGVFAEEMVRALKDRDVPVAGRDRMILTEHLAVMDLVAAGRFALLAEDDLNTAAVLKGPFAEMDEETLFSLAHGRQGDLWTELVRRRGENPAFEVAHARLAKLRERADQMPPYEFFSAILTEGGRESLLAHLGSEAADPIDEFMALTLDFERDHVPSLETFLHWVDRGKTEVKRDLEQSGGKVRVMTTHGAKGLQGRIVFLADTCTLPARQLADRVLWGNGFVLWPAFKDNEEAVTNELADLARAAIEREYRRLLYVGMTRAEDRLYVCGWKGERDLDDGCWHRLVEEGLKAFSGTETIETADGKTILRVTSLQTVAQKEAEPVLALGPGDVTPPEWARELAPAEPALAHPLSPSRQEGDPTVRSPLGDDGTERFKRGRLIHALLQTLPDLALDRRTAAAEVYLALPGHELDHDQQAAILTETLSVLNDPNFAELFGPGSRAEVPIVGLLDPSDDGKPVVVSGQVDRLLVSDAEIAVIDYKTNRPSPNSPDEVPTVYLRQMATYRALLQAIYPGRNVRAALIWTDAARLMALPEALLDAHAP